MVGRFLFDEHTIVVEVVFCKLSNLLNPQRIGNIGLFREIKFKNKLMLRIA